MDVRARLGPGDKDDNEVTVLNRVVRWTEDGIEMEADPRHVDIVCRDVGAKGAKVTTPLAKETVAEAEAKDEVLNDPDAIALYRSNTMRCGYLSQDRPDLCIAVRELAKGMKEPTTRHFNHLKRMSRYLSNRPRLVQLFKFQDSMLTFNIHFIG